MERSALKIHRRVFVSCSRAKGCNFCGLFTFCSETFVEKLSPLNALRNYGDRWGKLRRVRKHESHPAASLRWLARLKRDHDGEGKKKNCGEGGIFFPLHHTPLLPLVVYPPSWSQRICIFSSRKGNLSYRIRQTVCKRYRQLRSGIFPLSEFEHDWDNFRAYGHVLPEQKLRLKETNSNLICSSDYDTAVDTTLFRVSQTVLTNLIKKSKFYFSL